MKYPRARQLIMLMISLVLFGLGVETGQGTLGYILVISGGIVGVVALGLR
jgi:hypothetical protein